MQAIIIGMVLFTGMFGTTAAVPTDTQQSSTISMEEKLFWLGHLYAEARYNFVWFDQVPDLDWEKTYRDFIPQVLETKTDSQFYRTLQRFMVMLRDGHTDTWMSEEMRAAFDQPAVQLNEIDGKPVVVAVEATLLEQIPLGSTVLSVDGESVQDLLERDVLPYVSASTDHARLNNAFLGRQSQGYGLLMRQHGSTIAAELQLPDGSRKTVSLTCDRYSRDINWVRLPRPEGLLSFRWLEKGIAYVALNSFNDESIVQEWKELLPDMRDARGIVFDIRYNGGGNTANGTAILADFTEKTLEGSVWKTREHIGAYYAWSRYNPDHQYHDTYGSLNAWLEGNQMTTTPEPGEKLQAQVVVLIDYFTFSAAEDFLIFADRLEQFRFVGRPTNGSTGQPLFFRLPGGGGARICAKRDSWPDGREFVGFGIQPDVYAAPTVEAISAGEDHQLAVALEELKKMLAQ